MNRQKTHGVVYTPRWIADLILDAVGFSGKENGRVADPACGDGAFLVPVAERIIRANNARNNKRNLRARLENAVWGFDIDAAALRACGEKLNTLAQSRGVSGVNWNLHQADCMNRKLAAKHFGGFRFVVGKMRKGGTPLSAVARIHVGLTTLADSCYIFRAPEFDGEVALLRHPETGKATPVERGLLRPIVKASVLKSADEEQNRFILFPYEKRDGRHRLIGEDELAARFPLARKYFLSVKPALDARDKGRPTAGAWHAFGRTQGLDTSFGEKILTSPMNLRPNFIVWERPDHTFYSGYCVKFGGDLRGLAARLNSDEMAFYINLVSRCYRQNWRSFAKAFLKDFPVPPPMAAQAGGEKLFRAA